MVNLTRIVPKLNTLYLIYEGGNHGETGLDARISFTIIDWMYDEFLKKYNLTREGMNADLYTYLGIGETNYEKILRGKQINRIRNTYIEHYYNNSDNGEHSNMYATVPKPHAQVNSILCGKNGEDEMRLTIDGVPRDQWLRYFSLWHKIRDLRKTGKYPEKIDEAKRRRKVFEKKVKEKIKNGEINKTACNIKIDMEKRMFGDTEPEFENIRKMQYLTEHFSREEYVRYWDKYPKEFKILLNRMQDVTSEICKIAKES